MTPIESRYDIRLVTLLALAMDAIETLALQLDANPDQILSDYLFLSTKKIHERGEEIYLNKLVNNYPMLDEVLN